MPIEKGEFHRVHQIGIVVHNAEETAARIESMLKIPRSGSGNTPDGEKHRHGEKADFGAKMIFFDLDNVQLEIIEPLYGDSSWQAFLDEHGPGIHHILFNVKKWDSTVETLNDAGVELEMDGPSLNYPGARWGYMDCRDLFGFVLEMGNPEEHGYTPVNFSGMK